jgi:uncharacterized membrane protein
MSFFQDPHAMFVVGNVIAALSMVVLCAISWYFAKKLPSRLTNFWYANSATGRDAPRWAGLIAIPLFGLAFCAVGAYLVQPELTTLVKAQTGFWLRLGASMLYPATQFGILAHATKSFQAEDRPS